MTTKILTGTYASGFSLLSPITTLSITASGYVEGTGVAGGASHAYTILNDGRVNSSGAGVYLRDGGVVTNGSVSDETALIEGAGNGVSLRSVGGAVNNFGTIISTYANPSFVFGGVYTVGGAVTNGSLLDTTARIEGNYGVADEQNSGTATISNFATIQGVAIGVFTNGAGDITNGAATETGALIEGARAGVFTEGASVIKNFGTLEGLTGDGVYARVNGTITNGGAGDKAALIEGDTGVHVTVLGIETVTNFGAIVGAGSAFRDAGIYLGDGGSITNGSVNDHSALISGYGGVIVFSTGTVVNFGSIEATSAKGGATSYGLTLYGGGSMTNGAVNDHTALVSGYGGFRSDGAGSSTNFGIVRATGGPANAYGIRLSGGATFTNGSFNDQAAVIEGYIGAVMFGGDTLTNFGTIVGDGGVAVDFFATGQKLVVEAGSDFIGAVYGDSGTLDLASGVGTLAGLLSAAGDVIVSGSIATTKFQNFGTVEVGAGARFADAGAVTVAAGHKVDAAGTLTLGGSGKNSIVNAGLIETTGVGALTIAGTVTNTGTIEANAGAITVNAAVTSTGLLAVNGGTMTVTGAVTGTGKATINGGKLDLASSFTQNVTFKGTLGELELARSQTYAGTITGFSKTGGTAFDLLDIAFGAKTKATYSGATASGTLTVTDGTHTAHIKLMGDYIGSTFKVSNDGHGGTKIVDPAKPATAHWSQGAPLHPFVEAAARFGASGAGPISVASYSWRAPQPALSTPRPQIA